MKNANEGKVIRSYIGEVTSIESRSARTTLHRFGEQFPMKLEASRLQALGIQEGDAFNMKSVWRSGKLVIEFEKIETEEISQEMWEVFFKRARQALSGGAESSK